MELRKYIPPQFRQRSFAAAVVCIDGRTKRPDEKFVKRKTGATAVDTITDAGIVVGLAEGRPDVVERVRGLVEISVDKHNSREIVVGGHAKCAKNPVDNETHKAQVGAAVEEVRSWDTGANVTGVFTEPRNTVFRKRESTIRSWVTRSIT